MKPRITYLTLGSIKVQPKKLFNMYVIRVEGNDSILFSDTVCTHVTT